jgi:ATP-dependent Lhr-like helicase
MLDELCTAGEVVWVGRGALGRDDGRVALYRRDRLALLAPEPVEAPDGEVHRFIREHLRQRGASFYRDIYSAAGGGPESRVLDALWDLAWSGEVTNDTFAPLRALRFKRSGKRSKTPPHLSRLGPPEAAGRWSLTTEVAGPGAGETRRGHALAMQFLERYGVVTREAVASEGTSGGFAAVYPVLKALEESGRARRGYFIEGFGGAQFALPGAVDRLRAERETAEEGRVVVLAATDPANPWGASLAWPKADDRERRSFQRAAGAYVVLVDGLPLLYIKRGGKAVLTLDPFMDDPGRALLAIQALGVADGPGDGRALSLDQIDGIKALDSPFRRLFEEAGFERDYLGLRARAAGRELGRA